METVLSIRAQFNSDKKLLTTFVPKPKRKGQRKEKRGEVETRGVKRNLFEQLLDDIPYTLGTLLNITAE